MRVSVRITRCGNSEMDACSVNHPHLFVGGEYKNTFGAHLSLYSDELVQGGG